MRMGAAIAAGALLVLVAACGGLSSSGRGGGDPVALAGETEQGLRMRIEVVGDRQISVRIPVDCRMDAGGADGATDASAAWSPALQWHPQRATVDGDGSFVVEEDYVDADDVDGGEEHVEVRIEGAFEGGGSDGGNPTATGTVQVRARWLDGQGGEFTSSCESGTVRWTAEEGLRQGNDLVVPSERAEVLEALGSDVLMVTGGEALRVDHDTGEVRRLDGSAPAGAAGGEGQPGGASVPETAVSGGPVPWQGVAVVAGGLWMADPGAGAVTRTELADGRQTASIDAATTVVDDAAAGHGALWTVSTDPRRRTYVLAKRDPVSGAVLATVPVARGTLVAGPGEMWVMHPTPTGQRLARIDPDTLATLETFDVEVDVDQATSQVEVTEDRIWFTGPQGLTAVDPDTREQTDIDLPSDPGTMTADGNGVWVPHARESVIRRIEGTDVVRTVDVPAGWWTVATTADGAIWLAGTQVDGDGPAAIRLDPTTTGG